MGNSDLGSVVMSQNLLLQLRKSCCHILIGCHVPPRDSPFVGTFRSENPRILQELANDCTTFRKTKDLRAIDKAPRQVAPCVKSGKGTGYRLCLPTLA